MLHVYRRTSSESARELVWALRDEDFEAQRLKEFPHPIRRRNPQPGDSIICWGERIDTPPAGVRILNGAPFRTKYDDAVALRQANVPTVEVSRTRPVAQPVVDQAAVQARLNTIQAAQAAINNRAARIVQALAERNGGNFTAFDTQVAALRDERARLAGAEAVPVPAPRPAQVDGNWVGRANSHVGGADLLTPPATPDYFVKKLNLVREFRVHSFLGKSIRAGMKIRRDDFTGQVHPWVRSWDGGWRISYSNGETNPITNAHRELAHRAVNALGLQFGAVDLGQLENGSLIVLEVNRAPGIEAGTPPKYARAIQEWLNTPQGAN